MERIKNYKKMSCFKKLSSREMQVTLAIIDEHLALSFTICI